MGRNARRQVVERIRRIRCSQRPTRQSWPGWRFHARHVFRFQFAAREPRDPLLRERSAAIIRNCSESPEKITTAIANDSWSVQISRFFPRSLTPQAPDPAVIHTARIPEVLFPLSTPVNGRETWNGFLPEAFFRPVSQVVPKTHSSRIVYWPG